MSAAIDRLENIQQIKVASIVVGRRLRPLRNDTVRELADSINEIGLINPLTVQKSGRSAPELVTGAHRLEAVKLLKWDEVPCATARGSDADLVALIEIDENLARGDLSPAERAIHIAKRKEIYERQHPETSYASRPGRKGRNDPNFGSFSKDTAAKTGRSKASVAQDTTRAKHIPQIASVIGTSLDKGEELDALAKLPAAAQKNIIARAQKGEKVSAKPVAKRLQREKRETELAERTLNATEKLGEKMFGVIYMDPPWRFKPYSTETGMDRAADNHYPTMTIDDLAEIELPSATDCVLFMWTTTPFLEMAIKLGHRFGFAYKSAYYWCKPGPGTGYWSQRDQVEPLLIFTRGNVPAPAPGQQPPQYIVAPRQEHSRKPEHFATMIEAMFPNVPKLEMFARQRRAGWSQHGNQVGN